jgi:formate-dependent nitrite reductase membrane component NrfD
VGIAIYTGVLLGVLVSHPLWHIWLLPALFTVSALDTGAGFVLGYAILRESKGKSVEAAKETLEESITDKEHEEAKSQAAEKDQEKDKALEKFKSILEKATIILIVLELITLAVLLIVVSASGDVANISVQLLTTGALSGYFWGLLIVCGLLIPLIISVLAVKKHGLTIKTKNVLPLSGIALCLIGGCALRFLILLAGLPVHV